MKTTKYRIFIATALLMIGWTAACQKSVETNKANVNQPAANSPSNTNQPLVKTPEANNTDRSEEGSLATPEDAYRAAYTARQKKDLGGLKKTLSKDALEFFTEMGKADGKDLDEGLKELMEDPQAATAETRNVKIDGNKATLEYLDPKGGWSPMDFEKDGTDWKLTIPKAEPKETKDKTGKHN